MRDQSATFTSKGQLVIPAELRRKHGIEAGTRVKILEDQFGRIVLSPLPRIHRRGNGLSGRQGGSAGELGKGTSCGR